MALTKNLSPGSNRTLLNEDELYNPSGIEIHYGFGGKAVYGDDGDNTPYTAIEQSAGLHTIKLSRALKAGEKLTFRWRNNYELILFCDNDGKTKVKKTVGGTYQEIGKQKDGNDTTCLKFDDDVLTKRFGYIETRTLREF